MSRIAVFGATGLTGRLVVKHALAQGHEVVALVRDPARLTLESPGLNVIGGSPLSNVDVQRCVQGADAVIHCLGIGGMLKAIVGIEVANTRMEGKAKLSQNRELRDRLNAADTLMAKGAEGLGTAMRDVMKESI